jgi:hypothetical protein
MLTDEAKILHQAEAWGRLGRGIGIATVVERFGSAPRPIGSHLVIDEAGVFQGSVSGGCVEGEVVTAALDVIEDGAPQLLNFGVADEVAWRAGAFSVRTRHSSSRKTISMTQWRLFSITQWSRIIGAMVSAGADSDVM